MSAGMELSPRCLIVVEFCRERPVFVELLKRSGMTFPKPLTHGKRILIRRQGQGTIKSA